MNTNDRILESAIKILMEAKAISNREDIKSISDSEILRTPKLGRVALNKLREAYPFNREADLLAQLEGMRARFRNRPLRLPAEPPSPTKICLGEIEDVIAARLDHNKILIRARDSQELIVINLIWSEQMAKKDRSVAEGFGSIRSPDHISVTGPHSFPRLTDVRKVMFEGFNHKGDVFRGDVLPLWWVRISITTDNGEFSVHLSGNDDIPDRLGEVGEALSFKDEILNDRTFNALRKELELVWQGIGPSTDGIKAINDLCKASVEIEQMMRLVKDRASLRGVEMGIEHFRLTSSDIDDNDSMGGDLTVSWGEFFPAWKTPTSIILQAIRRLLEEREPIGIDEVLSIFSPLSPNITPDLNKFLMCYEEISAEIRRIYADLKRAGDSGILRKKILDETEKRFPADAMMQRAVKRWLYECGARNEIMRVKSKQGQVIVLSRTA